MTVANLSLLATALLTIQAVILFVLAQHNHSKRHLQAFLLFWLGVWLTAFSFYLLARFNEPLSKTWVGLTLDTANNFMLASCAYVLFRREAFSWPDKYLSIGWVIFMAAIVITITVGIVVPTDEPFWKMFSISPNTMMAAISLLALGIALFLEPTAKSVRLPALVVFSLYAFLQFPGYYFRFIGMSPEDDESSRIISVFLVAGKFSVLMLFIAVPLSLANQNNATKSVRGAQLLASIFSLGFTVLVLFSKVWIGYDVVKQFILPDK